jgi:hypothetical protein
MRRGAALAAALALAGCATTRGDPAADLVAADRALARWTSPSLETFDDDAEFRAYLRAARRAAVARGLPWAGTRRRAAAGDDTMIVVTGSRIPSRNASITNVQEAGVDEGDIVKQVGRFLLILQDGRIFVIDTGAGPGAPLRLADRINVYRRADTSGGTWYDEMLVHGDRIVVTGYSYRQNGSEISVFRLAEDGRIAREGTFFMSSNDYYDRQNYATRLVDGNLLIYTPVELNEVDPDRPIAWPLIRRWRPDDDRGEGEDAHRRRPRGRPLFSASSIYRPLFASVEPAIHTISLCPLGPDNAGRDLACRSTAFIGSGYQKFYVSPTDAFLLTGPSWEDVKDGVDEARCVAERPPLEDVFSTLIFRIKVDGRPPAVLAIRGTPFDHFSLQAHDGAFRALLNQESIRCDLEGGDRRFPLNFTYFSAPLSAFGPVPREARPDAYTPLPALPDDENERTIVDRFTDRYVVYGRLGHRRWRDEEPPRPTQIVAVPVDRPAEAVSLTVPHNVIRAEQAGENIVLTGYRDQAALDVSLIDLGGAPRVAATHRFEGRSESEGRSHAFNSLIAADGSGLMGLPTVARGESDGQRPVWRSSASDLSFLSVDAGGRLTPVGDLARRFDYDENESSGVPGYSCEVSCVDWYGNSRPIFTDGRIFALSGTELIEGRLENGRIVEVGRLNIALARPAGR